MGATFYLSQVFLLGENKGDFVALLEKAYVFHVCFSLLLVILFQLLSSKPKFFEQLGFIYMGALVFKIILFAILFYPQLLGAVLLSRYYRVSLLIPVIVFLPLEVIFISKIMKGKKA